MEIRTGFFEKKFWAFICTGILLVVAHDLWWVFFDPDISWFAKIPRLLLLEILVHLTLWLWHDGPTWVYRADENGISTFRYIIAAETIPWDKITRIDTDALALYDTKGRKILDLKALRHYPQKQRQAFLDYITEQWQKRRVTECGDSITAQP